VALVRNQSHALKNFAVGLLLVGQAIQIVQPALNLIAVQEVAYHRYVDTHNTAQKLQLIDYPALRVCLEDSSDFGTIKKPPYVQLSHTVNVCQIDGAVGGG
jgi:hypothetical protein